MANRTASRPPYPRAWLLAIAAFTAHNLEEILLNLPAWAAAHSPARWMSWSEHPGRFGIAALAITLGVCALAVWVTTRKQDWSKPALQLFATIMLVNAVIHIGLSIMSGAPMPGVFTAVALITPVMTLILWWLARSTA